jgi:hypothetical protein
MRTAKEKSMTEVAEFLYSNSDIGSNFREFASVYETLSDVWAQCPRPDWMLDILKRRNFGEAEKLERYIDSLSEQIDDVNEQGREWAQRAHFNYHPGVRQLEEEVESGKLSQSEARRRRLIWVQIVAYEATRYIFDDKVARFQFDSFFEQIVDKDAVPITDSDEIEFRCTLLNNQAELLRKSVGDPFGSRMISTR